VNDIYAVQRICRYMKADPSLYTGQISWDTTHQQLTILTWYFDPSWVTLMYSTRNPDHGQSCRLRSKRTSRKRPPSFVDVKMGSSAKVPADTTTILAQ